MYTQQEVINKAKHILNMTGGLKYGTINEIADMANGGDADGIREQYYSGKPDRFFKEVLAIVNRGE